ncbi:MAG: exodeoxyribonuclease VII large subunit [Clostridia bacterium]|nr:exodeoxyribonuclease VII large subunit [Clostridia bacterium]
MRGHIFTVTEANQYLKNLMEADKNLSLIYIKGEISNYKFHSSGHHYMTLKDESGAIRAVMFKYDAVKLKFRPESGMKVIAKGKITVYPRDGQYQLYIADMIPDGVGALYVAFEQLKKKLAAEGLFNPEHKKPLPRFPKTIALVTSPTGAAVRDMLRILKARWSGAKILIYPVLVQGEGAPPDIIDAINTLNANNACDLIITGRGGGSIEDLWAFNDEGVARAIFASRIPVISAVGHEPDVTIADFVADVRAATPSNAAELAVPDIMHLKRNLYDMNARLNGAVISKLKISKERLERLSARPIMQSPMNYFAERRITLDRISDRLVNVIKQKNASNREVFVRLASKLDAMSPLKVLGRGYSFATDEGGDIIKSVDNVKSGDQITMCVQDGKINCTVKNTERSK